MESRSRTTSASKCSDSNDTDSSSSTCSDSDIKKGRQKRRRSSTESIASSIDSRSIGRSRRSARSSSSQRMFPSYHRRSIERTYYSPNYCPWSRSTSHEREYSDSSDSSVQSKQNAICSKSVSNLRISESNAQVSFCSLLIANKHDNNHAISFKCIFFSNFYIYVWSSERNSK